MANKKTLFDIFDDDPFGLLNVKPSNNVARNEDERLVASFGEINDFYDKHQREPKAGGGIQEHQLYSRLQSIRSHSLKIEMLKPYDVHNLLNEQKVVTSISDIFGDDDMDLLGSDEDNLFDLKHVTLPEERASADFVAKRKSCKDFDRYEASFKAVQHDLASGKRKLLAFKEQNLRAGDYYVHNGILLYLEQVDFKEDLQPYKSGSRLRKDGRTRVIFENGTESNMLYRSLYKGLLANGKSVSENEDKANEIFYERFGSINEKDQDTGYIYVLKSKSTNPNIASIRHLYKIGYSTTKVEERIKNSHQEPTYLMADVSIIIVYNCYNMNPQKLEQLMHNFFGRWCLNLDVFDEFGQRHTPREWFIAPLYIIEQAIQLIISGEIVKYRYNGDIEEIVEKGLNTNNV